MQSFIDCSGESKMATMTIRNLDDALKSRLRVRAAHHGKSMEDEAREILRAALTEDSSAASNLAEAIRSRIVPLGGMDLPPIPRDVLCDPMDLDR
jgi:plasmid stability protein